MKCPKCQYIGFEQGSRCRNCGYDFSLSTDVADLDLPIKTGDEPLGPLADFTLSDDDAVNRAIVEPVSRPRESPDTQPSTSELPLFGNRLFDDDTPLVSLPAVPRAPVSVRKSAPARAASQRSVLDEPAFDLEPETAQPVSRRAPLRDGQDEGATEIATSIAPAPAGARLFGALIDLVLLGAIDVTVVYLTLRICGLGFGDIMQLPLVPLAAFLAMLDGGYMAAFTAAGGQSIGKMAAGTRVVNADESGSHPGVPLGQAVVRAAAYAISILPAGIGYLPALFGSDHRAFHDRLAQTRVVKA